MKTGRLSLASGWLLLETSCGHESEGWVYSGLSFRMAIDLGLNVDAANLGAHSLSDEEVDARRITFWGCFLIDKYVDVVCADECSLTKHRC